MSTLEPTAASALDLAPNRKTGYPAGYPPDFVLFHNANPAVYAAILEQIRELKDRGKAQVGMRGPFENLRYDPRYGYSINNDFSTQYTRLVEEQEPDLEGFINKRRTREEMERENSFQTRMEFD